MCFWIKIESERNESLQNFSKTFKFYSHVLVDAAPMMPMMLAQEASIIDGFPAQCQSFKPCWPALHVRPACKFARARVLMMLSRRAAWKIQNPSLLRFPCESARFREARMLCNSEEALAETEVARARSLVFYTDNVAEI